MKPEISEFSFGYALTEELIRRSNLPIEAAPFFPSLIVEGRPGGGYDVHLPFAGFPIFLQFKLSDFMVSSNAKECKQGLFPRGFYRMHLHPIKRSQQHNLLLTLEQSGCAVFYVAPHFHRTAELNVAYLQSKVLIRSAFFKPSEIGPLPNADEHHVAFKAGRPAWLLSDPEKIRDESLMHQKLEKVLVAGEGMYEPLESSEESLGSLARRMLSVTDRVTPLPPETRKELTKCDPGRIVTFLARTVFACDAILVRSKK